MRTGWDLFTDDEFENRDRIAAASSNLSVFVSLLRETSSKKNAKRRKNTVVDVSEEREVAIAK